MKWRKIIFRIVGTLSCFLGISLIVASSYDMSLNPTYLGYMGGMVMIGVGGILWLWELSHKPKQVKRK